MEPEKAPRRIMASSSKIRPKSTKLKVDGAYRNVKMWFSYKEQKPLWGAVEKNYFHLMYHMSENDVDLVLTLEEVIKSTWKIRSIQYGNRNYHGMFVENIYKQEEENVVTSELEHNTEEALAQDQHNEEAAQAANNLLEANVQRYEDSVTVGLEQHTDEAILREQDHQDVAHITQVPLEENAQGHENDQGTTITINNETTQIDNAVNNAIANRRRRKPGHRKTQRGSSNNRNFEVVDHDASMDAMPAAILPIHAEVPGTANGSTVTAYQRSCNELVNIIRIRGEFREEEWNPIRNRLLASLSSLSSSDLIRLMINILKKYEKELMLDWKQIVDYKTLFNNFYDELKFVNIRQSYQHKNLLQILRFQTVNDSFIVSNISRFYFQRICFELYHTYNLDASQINEVLDFVSDKKDFDFAELSILPVPRKIEESWFYDIKLEWLKVNCDVDDPAIIKYLAKLRWTVEMYQFAWNKFGNSISFEDIKSFTNSRSNLALSSFQSLKLLVETRSFKDMVEKANLLQLPKMCYSLFKMLNTPGNFEVCWSMIGNNFNKSDIEELVNQFKRYFRDYFSKKDNQQMNLDSILIFFCQSVTFNISFSTSESKDQLKDLIEDPTLDKLGKVFRKTIVEDIFHRDVVGETDVEILINQICKNNVGNIEDLRSAYKNFCSARDNYTPRSMEHEQLEHIVGDDYNYKLLVKTIKAMQKVFSNTQTLYRLREVQLLTVLYMIFLKDPDKKGVLCRMFTGEGKTIVVGILAAYFALKKQVVHIVTSSTELSIPQMQELIEFYDELGLNVGAYGNDSANHVDLKNCHIIYGTVSEFIRENLVSTSAFESSANVKKGIVLVDEVDNMLIDRSSGLVQLSSTETTALMPILYPILIKIYFQVRKEYGNYVAPEHLKGCSLEVQEQHIIRALKESFRNMPDDKHPLDKSRFLEENHMGNLSVIFPKLDASTSKAVVSFFTSDNIVYMPKVPSQCSNSVLKQLIANDLNGKPSDITVYLGSVSGSTVEAWLFLKNERAKSTLLQRKSVKIGSDHFGYEAPNCERILTDKKTQMSEYIKSDLKCSVMVAKALDKECGISEEKGIKMFLNNIVCDTTDTKDIWRIISNNARISRAIIDKEKFLFDYTSYMKTKEKLDFTLGYLRYVHLYSYASGRQFESTGMLLSKELYPIMRPNCDKEDLLLNIAMDPFLKRDFQPLQKLGEYQHIRENYQRGIGITLKHEYLQLIHTFPKTVQQHCVFQFDTWVENCYKAIMYISKNVGYVRDDQLGKNIKIDSRNTGVLQQNMLLADGLQQFLSMKENSVLNPISLTSSFQGIVDFFEKYSTLYGLTGTLGDTNTKSFLEDIYKVSIVEIPSHFRRRPKQIPDDNIPYRCYEMPGLVYKNAPSWLAAIAESVRQQLCLNRPVLVFCESVRILKDSVSPILMKICHELEFDVKVIKYDATNKFEGDDRKINERTLIIATNIAGRGIDIKIDKHMARNGGMHVCLTYLPSSQRVELQCVGRTARSGQIGTAQLILMDSSGRTINQLKDDRKKENGKVIQEAHSTITKLKEAAQVAEKFDDHMKLKMLAVIADDKEREILKDMHSFLWDVCESIDKSIFNLTEKEKKSVILGYERENGEVSDRVKEFFLKLERSIPRLSYCAYFRTVAGLVIQRYSFWMKRHCFNRSRELKPDILTKFQKFLNEETDLFETDGKASFEHHVFTAREAFRILLDKEKTNQSMNDLSNLFKRSGLTKIAESSAQTSYQFEGLALYYYAGYKCKKLFEEQPTSMEDSLKEIVEILSKSKTYIDHDIVQRLESVKNMLVPVNLVYNQLDFIIQIFRNLNDRIIIPLRNTIQARIDSKEYNISACEFLEFDPLLNFSSDYQYFKEQKIDISETVISHVQSFGFFGYFVLHFDPNKEQIKKTKIGLRLFRFVASSLVKLYNVVKSTVNFMHLRATTTVLHDSTEHEFIAFNVHAQQNFVCSIENGMDFNITDAMNRLELYLTMMGKSQGAFSPLARSILINKQTENGISEAVSISGEVNTHIYEGMHVFLNQKETFDSWRVKSDKVAEIDENIRIKQIELQSIYTRALYDRFLALEVQCAFIPLFIMDAASGHYKNENMLKEQLSDDESAHERSVISMFARKLFEALSIDSDSSCDEDAITFYVKMILNEVKDIVQTLNKVALKKCPREKAATFEVVALSRYKSFIAYAIKPFLNQVSLEVDSYFSKSKMAADTDMANSNRIITRALAAEIGQKLKKTKNKPLATCPMCNERVLLGNKLSNLAEAFGLILVFYSVPNRTQTFYPEDPVGVEKIIWDPKKNEWTMRQRRAPCILDLMVDFHGYPNLEKLTKSINELEGESVNYLLPYDLDTEIKNERGWHTSKDAIKECYLSLYNDPSSTILQREERQTLSGYHQIDITSLDIT